MSSAYYNEHDPKAAAWLRELIKHGHIAPGEVDERDIQDVCPDDLAGFRQHHFFAGIGGWSYALRLAGWPDDKPVWTGSCPCQPWSSAGKRAGARDKRNLWPSWFRLIRECRPTVIFGEQVASSDVLGNKRKSKNVSELWSRKERVRIFENWMARHTQKFMQGVSERLCTEPTCINSRIDEKPSIEANAFSQIARAGERHTIRSNNGLADRKNDYGGLRGDGNTVRYDSKPRMEHSILGQNKSADGVYDDKYPFGFICPECRMRELGREPAIADSRSYFDSAKEAFRRVHEEIDREIEGQYGGSWLSTVQLDLEGEGYAVAPVVFPACGVGAPEMRARTWFVAESSSLRHDGRRTSQAICEPGSVKEPQRLRDASGMGDSERTRSGWYARSIPGTESEIRVINGHLADVIKSSGATRGFWEQAEWIIGRDGKVRAIEPGTFPLAHGAPARVGRLRGYGNAIVAQAAAEVIRAYREVRGEP